MISIIICSISPDQLASISENIRITIGCMYEILAYDNRVSKKSIAVVYNEQAIKAKFNNICFLHEDVVLHTVGWGSVLSHLLKDKKIGLVGISGTVFKSKFPGTWSACDSSLYRTHSLQHFTNLSQPTETNINPLNEKTASVVVVDGVFMATTKEVFEQYRFDDKISGFHCYDVDYSLQIAQKFRVIVSYEILLEHFSEGNLNSAWLNNTEIVHNKWASRLPAATIKITQKNKKYNDYLAICCTLLCAIRFRGNKKLALRYYLLLNTRFVTVNKLAFTRQVLRYVYS